MRQIWNQRKPFLSKQKQKTWSHLKSFSRVAWRHSWQRSSLELELLSYCFALGETLELLFLKFIEETDSQRQIHFCAGAWLEFKRFWSLKKKKITVHVLTRFYWNMLKIKMRNSRNRRKFEFFTGYFWEDKIKLHIMTACMLSALRKQHVCNLKKNCNSNIFTRNCWKAKHRSSWMLLQISDGT